MRLILYSKPGCHLCEGLQEKLDQIRDLNFELEVRDITTQADWFAAYQYEIPVLCRVIPPDPDSEIPPKEEPLPRPSPRASVQQVQQMLQQYFPKNDSQ
ncbi:glutaredoxin family protein [Laspinema palackyanum]|uniref:glutaredoxin family protein n=1 Tax=Laspinema palackyanum TaxID=3231601 RepID=UPI00345DC11E|nr:glutaredoxin family protein [Laspinema sp. D2c]